MSKIVLEDFNKGDGYYKVNLAYLSKEQVEEIEALVSKWSPTDEDIKSCIGMCLTDVNEQRFKDYGTNLKDCLAWLEKQGIKPQGKSALESIKEEKVDNANKVESKQKSEIEKGKWYVCNTPRYTDFVVGKAYYCPKNGMLKPNENEIARYVARDCFHLWTIQDAKDGDILSNGKMIVIFKHFEEPSYKQHIVAYIGLDISGNIQITDDTWSLGIDKAKPATKEQRDLLFSKMKEKGYEWDTDIKKLKKIETVDIPFSAKDSELMEATYFIPEGFHAEIVDNKVIIRKGKQRPTIEMITPEKSLGIDSDTYNEIIFIQFRKGCDEVRTVELNFVGKVQGTFQQVQDVHELQNLLNICRIKKEIEL